MRHLKEEHWQRFVNTAGRDGLYFEELVSQILQKMEGGRWVKTPHSWDRGRDFFRLDRRDVAAEAKNHSAPLSIRTLSPSLVMAVADNLSEILFFSYSRINSNAIEHLASFEDQTNIRVRIFHDDSLEAIILRFPSLLREFFPTFTSRRARYAGNVAVTSRLTRDPETYLTDRGMSESLFEDSDKRCDEIGLLNVLETFALDFYLYNSTHHRVERVIVRFASNTILRHFELLDEQIEKNDYSFEVTLSAGEVIRRRVHFRTFAAGKKIQLPRWTVNGAGRNVSCCYLPSSVSVSSLFRSPLVGNSYISSLRKFERIVSFRDRPILHTVYGRSGSGKSRMLYELRNRLYKLGYRIIYLRGELARMTSFDEFFRRYLSARYGLPRQAPDEADNELNAPWREKVETRRVIDRLLYDPSWPPSANIRECEDAFLASLAGQRLGIILDDIQGLDSTTIQFFNGLTTKLLDSNHQIVVVQALNTDLVVPGSLSSLYLRRLLDLGSTHPEQVSSIELGELSNSEAREFLNNCLRVGDGSALESFTKIYSGLAESLLKELELTPLFVEQFILLLEQRGAISHDNIGYYVSDYKLVKREVASLVTGNNTRRLDVLLSRRFEAFEHTLSSKQWLIVDLLSKLLLIPSMAFDALGIELPDVSRLIELGLVVEDAGRAIEFRHQTLLRLMRAKRPASKEVDSDLEVFFRDSRWQMLYLPQFTLQEIRFNRLAKSQISTLFDHLDQGRVDASDLLPLIEPLVRLELDRLLSWFSAGYVIRIFDHTAYRLRPVLGYERAAELYQLIHSELHVRTKQLRDAGSEYVMLCVRFGSLLLGMRQDQKAMRVLKAAFSSVEDLQFLTENSKQEAIGLIANRLCAALLGHRRSLEARKVGLVAMKAARAGKCQYIEFQQHIDNGYIHYGFAAETPQLLAEWQNALSMFDEMFLPAHELITNRAVAKLHHSHILILEGKREEALELIRREILNCQISLDPFHEAKLSILGAIIFMLEGEDLLAAEEALEFVAHAKDISSRFDLGQVYWVAFHAGAKIWQILEEKEKAIGELSRAFEELVSVVENAEIEDRFDWFFEDYAVTLRLFQAQSLARDKSLIRRNKRREAVSTILAMADIEFSLFHSQYVPQSTYSRERLNFPCP